MENIRKIIKKRCGNGGFISYIYEKEIPEYSIEHVLLLRDEVKKDFPNLTDKHFGIKVDENVIVITFYVHEIPDINFDECNKDKKMLSKIKRVTTKAPCVSNSGNINIERKDIDSLNNKIREQIEENEKKKEKGIENMKIRRNRH